MLWPTPRSRVLKKLTGFQLVKTFPAVYGTRRSITLILSFHPRLGFPSDLFRSGFSTKKPVCTSVLPPTSYMPRPPHPCYRPTVIFDRVYIKMWGVLNRVHNFPITISVKWLEGEKLQVEEGERTFRVLTSKSLVTDTFELTISSSTSGNKLRVVTLLYLQLCEPFLLRFKTLCTLVTEACSLISSYQSFGALCRFHLQGSSNENCNVLIFISRRIGDEMMAIGSQGLARWKEEQRRTTGK